MTEATSRGARRAKAPWAARRTGEREEGHEAVSARMGRRKGSAARVGRESAKEPRKEEGARRAGSGKLMPPSEARRRA